jgi:hypothetical protein
VSEWMWFVSLMLGMILTAACVSKVIDAKVKIEEILKEELNNDDQDDSEDR